MSKQVPARQRCKPVVRLESRPHHPLSDVGPASWRTGPAPFLCRSPGLPLRPTLLPRTPPPLPLALLPRSTVTVDRRTPSISARYSCVTQRSSSFRSAHSAAPPPLLAHAPVTIPTPHSKRFATDRSRVAWANPPPGMRCSSPRSPPSPSRPWCRPRKRSPTRGAAILAPAAPRPHRAPCLGERTGFRCGRRVDRTSWRQSRKQLAQLGAPLPQSARALSFFPPGTRPPPSPPGPRRGSPLGQTAKSKGPRALLKEF